MNLRYILLFLFMPLLLTAQEIQVTASAPAEVAVGEGFRITFTVNEDIEDINFPSFAPLEVMSGPNKSMSSSFKIINGKRSHEVSNSYVFYVRANNIGKVNLTAAIVKFKGEKYQSNTLSINVVKSNSTTNSSAQNSGGTNNKTTNSSLKKEDVYVATTVNKKTVYLGEPILYSHKVYTKVDLAGFGDIKFPSYTGFWKEDIDIGENRLKQTNVNGEIYYTSEILRNMLFPQSTGEIKIQPTEIEVIARLRRKNRSTGFDSFFDDFFSSPYDNVKVNCKTKPQTIKVKPLPTKNKPLDFSGAVGNYTISTKIDKNSLKANEAITYTFTIRGNGNIKMIDNVDIKFPPDFEVYEPNITQDVKVEYDKVTGVKKFEYVLIPRVAGDYTIEPYNFSYFDPNKEKYITLKTPSFEVHIEESEQQSVVTGIAGVNKEEFVTLSDDIRFISDKIPVFKKNNYLFFCSTTFYLVLLFILLIFTVVAMILFLLRKKYKDRDLLKSKKADKVAIRRLAKAKNLMTENAESEFYEEVSHALWLYISDKFNVPYSNLNRDYLETIQKENNKLSEDDVKKYIAVIDDAEYVRFSPDRRPEFKAELYEKALSAIQTFNTKLK